MPPQEEQRILLTQALPEMALSRPVTLPNKVTLCKRGTVLNDELIHKLMKLGIKRIHVVGQPLPAPSQDSYSVRVQRLKERFSRCRDKPLMAAIEVAIQREMARRP